MLGKGYGENHSDLNEGLQGMPRPIKPPISKETRERRTENEPPPLTSVGLGLHLGQGDELLDRELLGT